MDYIPFEYGMFLSILTLLPPGMIVGLVFILVGALVLHGWKRAVYAVVGGVLLLTGLASMVFLLVTNSTYEARVNAFEASAAEDLGDAYGLEVTLKNLRELGYPTEEPDERTYFGTTVLKTGPAVEDFIRAQLAYDDGRVFLLQQVGEEYTELETAR